LNFVLSLARTPKEEEMEETIAKIKLQNKIVLLRLAGL
jgi:hypothetical protein